MATIKRKTGLAVKEAVQETIELPASGQGAMERRIADGIKKHRELLGLSANDLAERSGVSRAMVSKIERQEVSPTAALLGRLCNGLGITLSSLIASAEENVGPAIARATSQPTWCDPATGLLRVMVSPLQTDSRIEIVQIELPGGSEVRYEAQRHTHYNQQIWVQQGKLTLTLASVDYELGPGDCMRSRVDVAHAFANRGRGACKYLVFISRG